MLIPDDLDFGVIFLNYLKTMSNSPDRDESLRMHEEEEPTPRPPPGYFYTVKKYDGFEILPPMLFAIYPSFDFVEDVVELIEVR